MTPRSKATGKAKRKPRRSRRIPPDPVGRGAGVAGTQTRSASQKRGWRLGYFLKKRNPLAYVAQIAAVVGLIGSTVGLLFVFKPGWKPQPPPDVGTLEITAVDKPRVTSFRRYLERVRLPTYDLTPGYLRRRGLLIEFRYEAVGFRGKRLPIQWELIDAKTHDRVRPETTGDDQTLNDAVAIQPSTNDETATWPIWVPAPDAGRTYYVTVTIYRPRNGDVDVPLADFDTAEFSDLATK